MTVTTVGQAPLPSFSDPTGPESNGPESNDPGPDRVPMVELTDPRMLKVASDVVFMQKKMSADLLVVAVCWADAHPPVGPECAIDWWGGEEVPVPGNIPAVDRAAVTELAPAVGKSVHGASMLIYEALQLRHRMPRVWDLVCQYLMPAWKATKLVMDSHLLNDEAVSFIDRHVGEAGGDLGPAQLERIVLTAAQQYDPDFLARKQSSRYVHITHHTEQSHSVGASQVQARLDHVDALDLDAALDALAADSVADGGCGTVQVRRARALGDLARSVHGQDPLDLASANEAGGEEAETGGDPAEESALPPRVTRVREHTLYYHLSEDAVTAMTNGDNRPQLGECGTIGRPVLADQIRDWCGNPDAKIIVKPVIDLREPIITNNYRPSPAQREHIALTEQHCVFPRCTHRLDPMPVRRRANGTLADSWDADHIVAWRPGDRTTTRNLAPLCRRHHQAKTHEGWRYRKLATGYYLWQSPAKAEYLRTPVGTFECVSAPAREPEVPGWLHPISEPPEHLELDPPEEAEDPYQPPADRSEGHSDDRSGPDTG